MTVATTAQTLYDNARTVAMQFTGVSANTGDARPITLVKPHCLKPSAKMVKVTKVSWCVRNGNVRLLWGSTSEAQTFLVLSGTGELCFDDFGGLQNATEAPTGAILLSTQGFDAGSSYSILLEMQKK